MKPAKAIETLKERGELVIVSMNPDWDAANKLGIEALRYRLELEQEDPEITLEPLLGET